MWHHRGRARVTGVGWRITGERPGGPDWLRLHQLEVISKREAITQTLLTAALGGPSCLPAVPSSSCAALAWLRRTGLGTYGAGCAALHRGVARPACSAKGGVSLRSLRSTGSGRRRGGCTVQRRSAVRGVTPRCRSRAPAAPRRAARRASGLHEWECCGSPMGFSGAMKARILSIGPPSLSPSSDRSQLLAHGKMSLWLCPISFSSSLWGRTFTRHIAYHLEFTWRTNSSSRRGKVGCRCQSRSRRLPRSLCTLTLGIRSTLGRALSALKADPASTFSISAAMNNVRGWSCGEQRLSMNVTMRFRGHAT